MEECLHATHPVNMAGSHLVSFVNLLSSNQLPSVHALIENPYRHKGDLVWVSVEENQICVSCLV